MIRITLVTTDATRHLAHVKIPIRITLVTTVVISTPQHPQSKQRTMISYVTTDAEQYLKIA